MSDYTRVTVSTINGVNAETQKIQTAVNSKFDKSGGTLTGTVDMNEQRLINLPEAIDPSEPLPLGQGLAIQEAAEQAAEDALDAAERAEAAAAVSIQYPEEGQLAAALAAEESSVLISGIQAGVLTDTVKTVDERTTVLGDTLLVSAFSENASALDLYLTNDGYHFNKLNAEPLYTLPVGVMRDPSIIKRGDSFFIVYSDVPSNSDFTTTKFGIAKSTDLKQWDFVTNVDLAGFYPGLTAAWAPEWFVDNDGQVYVIIALNFVTHVIPMSGNNLQTAGTPINIGITGNQYIDGCIIRENEYYVMFIKNEDTKFVERFESTSLITGWTKTGAGNWAGWGSGLEGPSIIRLSDGTVRIYLDKYPPVVEYYASESASARSNSWSALRELTNVSGSIRHFTAIRIEDLGTYALSNSLREAVEPQSVPYVLSSESARQAEAVTSESVAPVNSAFQRYRSDADYAVFQARGLTEVDQGVDFVNRASLGLAAFEVLDGLGTVREVFKIFGATGQIEIPFGLITEALKTPSYINGWADGPVPLRYKSNSEGLVKFSGICSGGTATSGTVIFNLPVGWRPARTEVFAVVSNDTSFGSVGITSTGDVVILAGTNVKLDLSGICFYRA
jgi:hypothetical protein